MLTLAILAVAVVSTSALPTPELQRNAYDDFDVQRMTPYSRSGGPENEDLRGLTDELPEWSDRQDKSPLSINLIDKLGDNHMIYRRYDDGDIDVWKRRVDSLGGNNLVRRSLDRLGGNHLIKKALDRLGGNHLVRRALDTLGGNSLVKRRLDSLGGNSLVKRMLDSLGGNSLVKRPLDTLGGNSLVRRSLDTLGGNSLVKRRLDTLGGNSLVKRTLDSLGGNSLVKRRLDTLGGNRLVRRSLDNQIKKSREGNPKAFVDKLGGGHLLKRSPEDPEPSDNHDEDSETDNSYLSTDPNSAVDIQKDNSELPFARPWRHPLDTLGGSHLLRDSPLTDAEALQLLQFYGKISG